MYQPESFPHGLIGPVQVLWKPSEMAHRRKVWIRVHPSIFDDVLSAIQTAGNRAAGSSKDQASLEIRNIRDELECFELMGPLAGKVIQRVLRVSDGESQKKKDEFASLLGGEPAEHPSDSVVGVTVYDPRLA
jgi:ribonuclease P/MRP protein subunit POP1